jgi:hypothetical protein
MRRALCVALALGLGCSNGSGSVRGRGGELCLWPESWWDDQATLRVRGTPVKLGRARKFWSNGAWHGAFVEGALIRPERGLVFQGQWRAHGLELDADLLVDEEPVFTAWTPSRIGSAGLLTRGAPLRVLDARPGEVLVAPSGRAVEALVTAEPLLTTLRCEDLSLSRRVRDDQLGAVLSAGFRRDSERVRVKATEPVVLLDAPRGQPVGAVVPDAVGFVVGKQDDVVRLAVVRDGLLLVGWAPGASVERVADLTLAPVPDEVVARPSKSGLVWRQCDAELPLYVLDGEGLGPRVGTLSARQRLATTLRSPSLRASVVVLESNWFEADPGVVLLTPVDLSQCTSVIGPW